MEDATLATAAFHCQEPSLAHSEAPAAGSSATHGAQGASAASAAGASHSSECLEVLLPHQRANSGYGRTSLETPVRRNSCQNSTVGTALTLWNNSLQQVCSLCVRP